MCRPTFSGAIIATGICQNTGPGVHILPSWLLQCSALRHQWQSVQASAVDPERGGMHAFWQEPVDVTTSRQFCVVCIGFRWNSGSTSSWPLLLSTSRCEVKLLHTWPTTVNWSRTLDAHGYALLMPMYSLCREQILGSVVGVLWSRVQESGTASLPASLRQNYSSPDINLVRFWRNSSLYRSHRSALRLVYLRSLGAALPGTGRRSVCRPTLEFRNFKRLIKAFLFGETVWLWFQCAVYKLIYVLTAYLQIGRLPDPVRSALKLKRTLVQCLSNRFLKVLIVSSSTTSSYCR